ncbi:MULTISPECIES: hypothetical protein [unclassified Halomonas]|uniref:hypothetical protein n=1 Tax=unclassified Halomonas TaxID=2609666 RepID=UPI001CF23000|nr:MULTISPECIES: hypothetical protein [unclassified Halomonas]MCA8865305.1 hypothetical protein [Halomonas sp. SBBP1]UZH12268.1 hypothetical protein OM794_11265 [Halomonas sp. BDJS001]
MPPLLPEYLSQPVQIAVQTVSITDWWPVWVAAAATLIGSFGGAWIGGRVAYRSAVKANQELLRRQKLEEILMIVGDLEDKLLPVVGSIIVDSDKFTDAEILRIKEASKKIEFSLTMKLRMLLKVYSSDLVERSNMLHVRLVVIRNSSNQADTIPHHSREELLTNPGFDFQVLLGQIRDELINKLRLKI